MFLSHSRPDVVHILLLYPQTHLRMLVEDISVSESVFWRVRVKYGPKATMRVRIWTLTIMLACSCHRCGSLPKSGLRAPATNGMARMASPLTPLKSREK
jgi:hypothetical protein